MFGFVRKLGCYTEKVEALLNKEHDKTLSTVLLYLNSGICNQDCIYCDKNFYQIEPRRFTKEILNNLLTDMTAMGVDSMIILGEGGEPIIDTNLPWLIKEASLRNLACGIYTNGSLINEEIVEAFNKLEFLRISLDAATSETHQVIHQYPSGRNDFENCIELIEAVNKKKVMVGVAYIILDENIDEIYKAWSLMNEMQVEYIEFKLPLQKGYKYKAISADKIMRIKENINKILNANEKHTKVVLNKHLELLLNDEVKSEELTAVESRLCYTSCFRTIVSPLGYFLCSPLKNLEEYRFGDPFEESLIEAWNSEKRHALIEQNCNVRCTYYRQNEVLARIVQDGYASFNNQNDDINQKHFL